MSRNLAETHRPKTMTDICLPDSMTSTLKSFFQRNVPPPAILFSGPSGCGKTTLGRMAARYFNCETRSACGKCDSCRAFNKGDHPDVKEINASADRTIDDARRLIQTMRFSPVHNFRFAILDEAHNLVPQAAEALLKELEDPAPRSVYVICTTEPHKFKPALIGRCHRFNLPLADPEQMMGRMYAVAKKEGVDLVEVLGKKETRQTLTALVAASNGQYRDGMFVLEQLLSQFGKKGTKADIAQAVSGYLRSFDTQADDVARLALIGVYLGGAKATKKAIASLFNYEESPRTVMHKMRWLNDMMVRDVCGATMKFVPPQLRQLRADMQKLQASATFERILVLQTELALAELRMNQGVAEMNAMVSAVYKAGTS